MKTCNNCKFGIGIGGDIVTYGNTSTQLPIIYECDCSNIPEEIYDDYDKSSELANSGKCEYWESK